MRNGNVGMRPLQCPVTFGSDLASFQGQENFLLRAKKQLEASTLQRQVKEHFKEKHVIANFRIHLDA